MTRELNINFMGMCYTEKIGAQDTVKVLQYKLKASIFHESGDNSSTIELTGSKLN